MNLLKRIARFYFSASHLPECLAPLMDLGLRFYLANVFFKSGWTKIQSWDSTLYLFNDVYHVPLLPPAVAATMAASAELGLSVLLVLGLFGRFAASGLVHPQYCRGDFLCRPERGGAEPAFVLGYPACCVADTESRAMVD